MNADGSGRPGMVPAVDRVVRVLPDEPAIDRVFDYVVPASMAGSGALAIGTEVRIVLHGRAVGGWVVDVDVEPPPGVALAKVAKIRGHGPPAEVVDLCRWVAHRWVGRLANVMRFASPPGAVRALPERRPWRLAAATTGPGRPRPAGRLQSDSAAGAAAELADAAVGAAVLSSGGSGDSAGSAGSGAAWSPAVVRWPPATPLMPLVRATAAHASGRGSALVIVPDATRVDSAARRLRQEGVAVAVVPRDWALAAAGGVVAVGSKGAAFAPLPDLMIVLVIDEHDETLHDERVPTWHARDVVVERARRAAIPCVVTSPCPSLEAQALVARAEDLVVAPRAVERSGWAPIRVVDRSLDEPRRRSLVAPEAVAVLRGGGRVLCILNRTGHVRLARCVACRTIARCESCGAAVARPSSGAGPDELVCPACGVSRPPVCLSCGGGKFAVARAGTSKAREEIEILVGEAVGEVTSVSTEVPSARVLVGTEALLRRVERADAVLFLDFDADLLAPRFRAPEQSLAMLAKACRVVGGRVGQVLVQTRSPRHEVLEAAAMADPGRLTALELDRRARLRLPPLTALAKLSGPGAAACAVVLRGGGTDVADLDGGAAYLVRAESASSLASLVGAALRGPDAPAARVRVEIDPLRV